MGLFDRRKKNDGPSVDALTLEAIGRIRALPGVVEVTPVDGNTLSVTWSGGEHGVVTLTELRPSWAAVKGFDRIEVMDQFFAAVSPPPTADTGPEPTSAWPDTREPVLDGPATSPVAAMPAVVPRITTSPPPGAVSWPLVPGLHAVVDVAAEDSGQPSEIVRDQALRQLRDLDPELDPIEPGQPAWVATQPSGSVSAWLCAPDRLLTSAGLSTAVVLSPLISELVIVDPSATDLLASILSSTLAILDQTDGSGEGTLLPYPLLATAERLEPWDPGAGHPCDALVAQLRARRPS